MAETSQPAPADDSDGTPQPFAHVHADKQAVYRAILEIFSEAKQRFVVHLRPEDVAERLQSPGADRPGAPLWRLVDFNDGVAGTLFGGHA